MSSVLSCLAIAGCYSFDPETVVADGRPLTEVPPIPYRVAIAPVEGELDAGGGTGDELCWVYDRDQLQSMLIRELDQLAAATEVFAVTAPAGDDPAESAARAMREATLQRADLLIRPRVVTQPSFGYEGKSWPRWLVSTGLAMLTGPVNMFTEASTYRAEMVVDFVIESPHHVNPLATHRARIDRVDLSHWDRHDQVSMATAVSVLWPSWTLWDDADVTQRSLSQRVCAGIGARLTKFLKDELADTQREALGELYLETPTNRGPALLDDAGQLLLRGKIVARYPIHAVDVFVDQESRPRVRLRDRELGDATEQRRVGGYEYQLDQRLQVEPGERTLGIEMVIRGQLTSRTLEITVPGQP